MTLLDSVIDTLKRDGFVTLDRPGRAGRTLGQQRNRRTSTIQQRERAQRDARMCEWTEDDRRLWSRLDITIAP